MRWPISRPKKDITEWHTHFAWIPVKAGGYRYWLCFVNRRALTTKGDDPEGSITWEYSEAVWYP